MLPRFSQNTCVPAASPAPATAPTIECDEEIGSFRCVAVIIHIPAARAAEKPIRRARSGSRVCRGTIPLPIVFVTFLPIMRAPASPEMQVTMIPCLRLIIPEPMSAPTQFAASFEPMEMPMKTPAAMARIATSIKENLSLGIEERIL